MKQIDQVAQAITHLTFDVVQRKFKVTDMARKEAAWIAAHPGATPAGHFEALRRIAKEVNAVYGGLHWENLGLNRSSIGLARALMLAPDWTFSNFLNAGYAFGDGPGGNAARLFWLKSAIWIFALTQGLSLLLSGKPSKDPTRVNMGKDKQGRDITQNVFATGAPGDISNLARYVDRYGAFAGLGHFLGNKLSNFGKAGIHQITGHDELGRQIAVKDAGVLKNTVRGASELAKDIVPVPFGLSTIVRMLMDKQRKYSMAEYAATVLGGMPPTHQTPAKPPSGRPHKPVPWTVPLSSTPRPVPDRAT